MEGELFEKLFGKQKEDQGEVSDGYHTFNELYEHRAALFSVICHQNSDRAWKSLEHSDGTMFEGMFIVGIRTPCGQVTYHYDKDLWWSKFNVEEFKRAPVWDGSSPEDCLDRIYKFGLRKMNFLRRLFESFEMSSTMTARKKGWKPEKKRHL